MKCVVCETELQNAAKCPRCGFANFKTIKMDKENEAYIADMAAKHRSKLLTGTGIGLRAYAYKKDDSGALVLDSEKQLHLVDAGELELNSIRWAEYQFGRSRDQDILPLLISLEQGTREQIEVTVPAPALEDVWQVGVELIGGLQIRLAVGSEQVHTLSAPIPLRVGQEQK